MEILSNLSTLLKEMANPGACLPEIVFSTWNYRAGVELLRAAIDYGACLIGKAGQRLGSDLIGLYQLHWPNLTIPVKELISGMEKLLDEGKVRFIGVSNFSVRTS